MKNIKAFTIFESQEQNLMICYVEDYMVEVLDKYKDIILRYIITENWADPIHLDLYDGENFIENGQLKKRKISETPPEGSFLTFDILIEISNDSESLKFGWEGFCDFDVFTKFISDLKNSMNRLKTQTCAIQVTHSFDKHIITLSFITKETKNKIS
jgi:hypothetical protein